MEAIQISFLFIRLFIFIQQLQKQQNEKNKRDKSI